jgi:hypothetical protein
VIIRLHTRRRRNNNNNNNNSSADGPFIHIRSVGYSHLTFSVIQGCVMSHAVYHRLLTVKVRIRSGPIYYGFVMDEVALENDSFQLFWFLPVTNSTILYSHSHVSLIRDAIYSQ